MSTMGIDGAHRSRELQTVHRRHREIEQNQRENLF
jgi:hypothetical protein